MIKLLPLFLLFLFPLKSNGEEICRVIIENKELFFYKKNLPYKYKKKAECKKIETGKLENPDSIILSANQRVEKFNSSIGKFEIRWNRSTENYFGRSPYRAVTDAIKIFERISTQVELFKFKENQSSKTWKIIFIDDPSESNQIPEYLKNSCHPGWMTPPANIYIASEIVAGKCGNKNAIINTTLSDEVLSRVLVHEFGHVAEIEILKNNTSFDRARAEGFATWFEAFADSNGFWNSPTEIKEEQFAEAKRSLRQSGADLSKPINASEYARNSMYFHYLYKKAGINGVRDFYNEYKITNAFQETIAKLLSQSTDQLENSILDFIKDN